MKDMVRLLKLAWPYRTWLLAGVALSLSTVLANIALLAVSGWFIASMALAGITGATFNYHYPAAGIRFFALWRTVGRYAERIINHQASLKLLSGLRVWIYQRIEPIAPARLESYGSGDLLSRIRADVDVLDTFYLRLLIPLLTALCGTVIITLFLCRFSITIACSTLALLLLAGAGLPLAVHLLGRTAGKRLIHTSSELRTTVVDSLRGMEELLVYGAEKHSLERVEKLGRELEASQRRLAGLAGISSGGSGLCAGLAMWLTLIIAIPLVRSGVLQGQELVMLALFCLAAFEVAGPLPAAFRLLGQVMAAGRRIFSLADQTPAVSEPPAPNTLPLDLTLSLRGVGFSYRENSPVLHGIDLELSPGKKIALVGASGAGKSTLLALLLRFREYDSGSILLGGSEIRTFTGEDVRRLIAVAPQQVFLFNASLRENLLIARPDASDEELAAASKLAGLHDEIMAQPDGYDILAGEGGMKLSGGQARRLSIARAILKGAPIMLLDEPTEGLDTVGGKALMEEICRSTEGRSLLVITHGTAGLDAMDEILLLDEGKIVDRGHHSELVLRNRQYQDLCRIT